MPNEANAHKQFLDVTKAYKSNRLGAYPSSLPRKIPNWFSEALKLMWTEVWKVWFHQTAQLEAVAKSEIQKIFMQMSTVSSCPGQAEEKFLVSVASATGSFWKSPRDFQC